MKHTKNSRCLSNRRYEKVIEETSKGSSIPAWDTFGKKIRRLKGEKNYDKSRTISYY